ncbi:hypothetical protein Bbelb_239490 [Branchiostoma belcheri]|nr:hypothetical protein Bbelb_239490 [Branchiostoma belcheri]
MSGSRRTYRTLPLDVPHSPAERIALSRRTSRTLPREVPHSVLHSPAERPSKIDAYFVACAVPALARAPSGHKPTQPPPDSPPTRGGDSLDGHFPPKPDPTNVTTPIIHKKAVLPVTGMLTALGKSQTLDRKSQTLDDSPAFCFTREKIR